MNNTKKNKYEIWISLGTDMKDVKCRYTITYYVNASSASCGLIDDHFKP